MIKIICVGKVKEKYLREAIADYQKRISRYHKIDIIEVEDSNMKEEAERINHYIKSNDYVITLEIEGNMLTSIELANKIDKIFITEEDIAIKFKATIDQDGDSENFNYDSEVEFNSTSESNQLPRIIMTHGSSCNGTKLPLNSGSLRTDIRTGLLHKIYIPSV